MKKYSLIFVLVLSVVIGSIAGFQYFHIFSLAQDRAVLSDSGQTMVEVVAQTERSEVMPNPTAPVAPVYQGISPNRLIIPKIGIDASVEDVALDNKKNMDVPKEAMNVGWYSLGYKPGAVGNAVMAGHLDKKDGSAAVFYKLNSLEIGDSIFVTGDGGEQLEFRVTGRRTYPTESFPIGTVFGEYDVARLNLITCSGTWDSNSQSYTTRTVVFSELVQDR